VSKVNRRKPIKYTLDGPRYCSPACGCDCSLADYELAKGQAACLVKQLGKGWRPVVHENMGWHYHAVHKSGATLHEHGRSCWIQIVVGGKQIEVTESSPTHARNSLIGMLTGLSMGFKSAAEELDK
jgi:hypothetical protein